MMDPLFSKVTKGCVGLGINRKRVLVLRTKRIVRWMACSKQGLDEMARVFRLRVVGWLVGEPVETANWTD